MDLCVLSIYKNEGARVWGWQRSPNKNKKAMLPQACALTERSEKRTNCKGCFNQNNFCNHCLTDKRIK